MVPYRTLIGTLKGTLIGPLGFRVYYVMAEGHEDLGSSLPGLT